MTTPKAELSSIQRWYKPGYPDERYGCIERVPIFENTKVLFRYRVIYGINVTLPDGRVVKGLRKVTRVSKSEAQEVLRNAGFKLYYDTRSNRSNLSESRK